MLSVVALSVTVPAASHGMMQMPPSWIMGNAYDNVDYIPGSCTANGCRYFSNYTFIEEPTIGRDSPLRTELDFIPEDGDWTRSNPWRAPGRAPIHSPCGIAGGNPNGCGGSDVCFECHNGHCAGGGYAHGPDMRTMNQGIVTHWPRGGVVEVGWSMAANHGGGYSYRLCQRPEDGDLMKATEECFQRTPLDFVGNRSWMVYTKGEHKGRRYEIDATHTTEGTWPRGSMWARNPIPNMGGEHATGQTPQQTDKIMAFFLDEHLVQAIALDPTGQAEAWEKESANTSVGVHGLPFAPPSLDGKVIDAVTPLIGFSPGTGELWLDDLLLVDHVQVPSDLPEGDYILSFRWDCEQTSQVWNQCASIRIESDVGPANAEPKRTPGPLCGDEEHGCWLPYLNAWSATSHCTAFKGLCEANPIYGLDLDTCHQATHIEDCLHGCSGIWVNRSEHELSRLASIPASNTCKSTTHACGLQCGGNRTDVFGIPQCKAFHATGYCTTSREVCESDACQHGTWLPVKDDFHHLEHFQLPVMV